MALVVPGRNRRPDKYSLPFILHGRKRPDRIAQQNREVQESL